MPRTKKDSFYSINLAIKLGWKFHRDRANYRFETPDGISRQSCPDFTRMPAVEKYVIPVLNGVYNFGGYERVISIDQVDGMPFYKVTVTKLTIIASKQKKPGRIHRFKREKLFRTEIPRRLPLAINEAFEMLIRYYKHNGKELTLHKK